MDTLVTSCGEPVDSRRRPRSPKIPLLRLRAAAAGVLWASLVCAQVIQKWQTPDGKLYFGDRPPPGSTKIGQQGSNEPPAGERPDETAPTAPRSTEEERLSIDVSRSRTEIEKALNGNAERLGEVEQKIAEVERQPDFVTPWMEKRAGIKNEKAETLRELRSQQRAALAAVVELWKKFDDLDTRVKKSYDGKAPDWWRSTLRCANCPSRREAEAALR